MGARDFLNSPAEAGPSALTREFEFQGRDFDRVRDMIYRCAGIHLAGNKQHMVYSRLSRRLRHHNIRSFTEYLDRIDRDAAFQSAEAQEFVNALTTNLTSFFREAHHFPILAEYLGSLPGPARIWCNAASTGEEPYSLAMTMIEAARGRPAGNLLATDIDTHVLGIAEQGRYDIAGARGCGEERLKRHFLRGTGENSGKVRVRPELQRMIRFGRVNLLDEDWPLVREFGTPLDVVFCRNVMIYFDRATQKRVLERIAAVLKPGGLLFAGHSESFTDVSTALTLRGQTVYVRR
jgi:chemotaxis protein methyltransferase CheR